MQYSTVFASALLVGSAVAGYTNGTTVTTDVTVTDYTTYCPYSTVVTVTKCEQDKCHPTEITVTEATTLTVTGECVVPTTYTTEVQTKTETVCDTCEHPTTAAPTSAAPTTVAGESTSAASSAAGVTSFEGAAARNVAGAFAGVAAVAAALL
ncbi:DEHA2D02332p [Debaryomyces hansenii CBS767]|jgi:hypothetical protein|uniref:DEHA2D02332p n=1 Tax=Debaryomyces hansenii (strain ATCC 36239 / CBS 767 / BCRC 21394 / JCM 1990 / NBRC 0083 / IGC 2968) TaxID=284592 RepID=Q6BTA1_DEBHA|nr:DEHA2D02332p [Debaryomyces hansenii CBS767]CAG86701.1 DEHA2D02332p [Debaryomyces hansenii CBS767]|eukprot:XP_458569.1 DEHA2D02332p [Debaryomyces hansenii CBS767]